MSRDAGRDLIVSELIALRRQSGPYETRLAASRALISLIGGGNLRYARDHLQKIRRAHADDPDGDVATYFATAGYRTTGDTLDARLRVLAQRHHVSEKTVLRRSDRGAVAIAQLIRHEMRYERPFATLIALQDGDYLRTRVTFSREPGEEHPSPFVYLNGRQLEIGDESEINELGHERHLHQLDPIPLDFDVEPDEPMLELLVVWVPTTTPLWDIGTHLTNPRLYSRHSFDAIRPNLTLQIMRASD